MSSTVNIVYKEPSTTSDEYLRYSQIIADAFLKALDDNECNVKVLIGIAQEIQNEVETVKDMWEMMSPTVYSPQTDFTVAKETFVEEQPKYTFVKDNPNTLTPSTINAVKKKLKDSCIDCKLDWPGIDFNENFNFSFNKLKAFLDTYFKQFKELTNPNFCQVAQAFNFSCLQDLIKLITLLLSAYSAILALRKLSSISLSAFIKGVLTGLLGQLLGSISLQLDANKTGLPCIIKAFEELASRIPDGQNLAGVLDEGTLNALQESFNTGQSKPSVVFDGTVIPDETDADILQRVIDEEDARLDPENKSTTERIVLKNEDGTIKQIVRVPKGSLLSQVQKEIYSVSKDSYGNTTKVLTSVENAPNEVASSNSSNTIPKEDKELDAKEQFIQEALAKFGNPNDKNFLTKFSESLAEDYDNLDAVISGTFKYVNSTIKQAVEDFNNTISNLFGLLEYFMCEAGRTGTDFVELLEYITKLMNVINLLSAIISIVAKKQVKKLCKTKESLNNFSNIFNTDLTGSNDLDPTDVLEEFVGKVVEETRDGNNNIIPIIYDKPVEQLLPKLSLKTCNLLEFIEAHKPDNIIEKAIEAVQKDLDNPVIATTNDGFIKNLGNKPFITLSKDNVIDKKNWKLYPIQFINPSFTNPNNTEADSTDDSGTITNSDFSKSFNIDTILSFIYNNPLDKKQPNTDLFKKDTSVMITPEVERETDMFSDVFNFNSNKNVKIKNECKNIDDVLSTIANLNRK